jgi:hypothetical protein
MQQEKQARAWQQDMQEKVGTDTLPRYSISKSPHKENMKKGTGKAIFILPSLRGSSMKETPRRRITITSSLNWCFYTHCKEAI